MHRPKALSTPRALALVVATLVSQAGCGARESRDDDGARAPLTSDETRALMSALAFVPAVEREPFDEWLQRARASLAASDDADARALAHVVPDDGRAIPDARYRAALPALLAAYAKSVTRDARVSALSSLIRHETVNADDATAPGRSPAFDAFEAELAALALRERLAFDHVDHIAYEVRSRDVHHDEIGVLVHADVVPAGERGWSVPPFGGLVKDGRVYGRGAIDDKGPLVAALFAMSALEQSGVPFIKGFRLVVGTSEETRWAGIDRYQAVRAMPRMTFVADASFPVGVGEKGIATLRIVTPPDGARRAAVDGEKTTRLLALTGGQVANQVPSSAEAVLAVVEDARADALVAAASQSGGATRALRREDGAVVVMASGRAAHSAEPEKGDNALVHLVRFLTEHGGLEPSSCGALLGVLRETLVDDPRGAGLGVAAEHPRFSPSTVNLGKLVRHDDGRCEAHVNVRWPPPRTVDDVMASARAALMDAAARAEGGPIALDIAGGGLSPTLVDERAPLVAALLEAYGTVTGKEARPVTVSGTTYAKAVPGAVTFGPAPEDDGEARLHGPDEHLGIDELDALVEMYAFALARLAL